MKRMIILFTAFLIGGSGIAQEIHIYDYDTLGLGPDYENLAGTVVNEVPGGGLEQFWIRNVTESIFEFRIERVKIEQADGAQDFFVFGGSEDVVSVYGPGLVSGFDPFVSPDSHPLGGPEFGYLGSHYLDNESSGCSQFRYYILNELSERLDSLDVRFCSTVSTPENSAIQMSIYPNPSTNFVRFQMQNKNTLDYELTIYDLLGKEVYHNSKIPNELSIAHFETGVYQVSLKDPITGETLLNKKLVKK